MERFGNALRGLGVGKGHTVAIYMPMVLDLVVAMLACARIGAPHSIVVSEARSEKEGGIGGSEGKIL